MRNRPRPRAGFTLIEIMVAIAVIAVLVAMLLPALGGARASAQRAQVRAEISRLEQALADFKAQYGTYPPSRIVLTEDGPSWTPESRAIIQSIWPQFDFDGSYELDQDVADNPSVDDNGETNNETIVLDGAECLLFFLGGYSTLHADTTKIAFDGFSKDPRRPFRRGGPRVGPFFEFDIARLRDADTDLGGREYLDPLPNQSRPYLYLSSYEGTGYRAFGADGVGGNADDEIPSSVTMEGYWQNGSGSGRAWWKPKTFQIISPGPDGEYGSGGLYTEATADDMLRDTRAVERDNITNFSGPRLAAD